MIGIIGAMNEEVVELRSVMQDRVDEKIGGLLFSKGILEGKEIVLVEGGIGKVNAAICTTILISHFGVEKVIFTGVAGGVDPKLDITDIVIGKDLIQHDVDVRAFGYELGQIPRVDTKAFRCDDKLVDLAYDVASSLFGHEKVSKGRIVSGDQFIASNDKIAWLGETFNASCTEMEGASVAQACYILNVPFLVIRAISDKADSDAKMDYPEFVKIAAQNSKLIVEGILRKL